MSTHHVKPTIDTTAYWIGLARQDVKLPQALGELIDNSLSARLPNAHGSGLQTTLVEISIIKQSDCYKLIVADPGRVSASPARAGRLTAAWSGTRVAPLHGRFLPPEPLNPGAAANAAHAKGVYPKHFFLV